MVAGGPRLAWLETIRSRHPVSLHGVAMLLAGDADPDTKHLERLAALVERIEPFIVSEHLAWSAGKARIGRTCCRSRAPARRWLGSQRTSSVQDVLGRRIAIENPSHYLRIDGHEWSEIDFLTTLAERTGCRLLLDVTTCS